MYWPFTKVPELADLPPAEQRRLWSEAVRDRSNRSDLLVVALVLFLVACVFCVPLFLVLVVQPMWVRWPLMFITLTVMGKCVQYVVVHHYRRVLRRRRISG